MSSQSLPSFTDFVALVRATDEDADHRLPLLQQAAPLLYTGVAVSAAERDRLAEKFERWRYQRLNKYGGNLAGNQRLLVDNLDLAANVIAQGRPRPPKDPRSAVESSGRCSGESAAGPSVVADTRIDEALSPECPLETVTEWAAELTRRNFHASLAEGRDGGSGAVTLVAPGTHSFNRDPAGSASLNPPTGLALPAGSRLNEPTPQSVVVAEPATRWRMLLYAPLYLSSYCVNHCLYCAFRYPHELQREHLSKEAAIAEAEILWGRGFRHVLLVAGDFPRLTSTDYFVEIIESLVERGFSVAIEVAPQSTVSYARMIRAGACGVTLYQETYQEDLYARYHPRGTKVWFDWRLETPERAAEAGASRLGLGILLGLGDPVPDLWSLIRHGQYLLDRYPHVRLGFSLPRIHEAPDGFEPPFPVEDETLIRLYCALRLAFPCAQLVLSTRERPALRDRLANTCITQMSAESCTAPGGYSLREADPHSRQQFPVADHRSVAEVAASLRQAGFELRWQLD